MTKHEIGESDEAAYEENIIRRRQRKEAADEMASPATLARRCALGEVKKMAKISENNESETYRKSNENERKKTGVGIESGENERRAYGVKRIETAAMSVGVKLTSPRVRRQAAAAIMAALSVSA
jgi:hypothetical protein